MRPLPSETASQREGLKKKARELGGRACFESIWQESVAKRNECGPQAIKSMDPTPCWHLINHETASAAVVAEAAAPFTTPFTHPQR